MSVIFTGNGFLCYQCYMAKKKATDSTKKNIKNSLPLPSPLRGKYPKGDGGKYSEAHIQSEFFRQIKLFFPNLPDKLLFHVPNGGSRNKLEAINLKRQGTIPGVADVILLIPKGGFASLCMEFKTDSGRQTAEQKKFQKQAEKAGNKYVIVRSVKEAIENVREYLIVSEK